MSASSSIEYAELARDHLASLFELCEALEWPSYARDAERTWQVFRAPGSICQVALDVGRVCGVAQLQTDREIQAHLSMIGVLPSHRRRGIAQHLLREIFSLSGAQWLDLVSSGEQHEFYRRFAHSESRGFRLYPSEPDLGEVRADRVSPEIEGARYVHTNIVARDWRGLAEFYSRLFGCTQVPPERDYGPEDLEAGTGIAGARLRGAHLLLPGYPDDGPTLEIFEYADPATSPQPEVNRPGLAHLAFSVRSVRGAREQVCANGGSSVGEIVTLTTRDDRSVTWCYVRDPEGNVIELQSWK